jgi:hypothetical protein
MTLASERATAGVVAGTGFALRTLEKTMAWLYGPRVISLRGAWSGLMISLAAFPILAGVTFVFAAPRAEPQLAAKYGIPIVTLVLMLLIGLAGLMTWGLLVAANLPVRFKRFQFTVAGVSDLGTALLISAPIITLCLRIFRAVVGQGKFVHPWAGIALMLTFGALENMISLSILRWAGTQWEEGRRQHGWGRILSALVVFAAGCGALFILVRAPAMLALLHGSRDLGWQALVLSILTNALEVIFMLSLLAVVGFFLVHAAIWDALLRVIEKLHVELPKKTMVAIGLLLLTGQPIWGAIKKALDLPATEAVQAVPVAPARDAAMPKTR